jgi:hypothetical protein
LGYDRETLATLAEQARTRPAAIALPPRALLGAGGGVATIAALLLWLFVAGPLAGRDGRLIVNSDPPGATVTVDGNQLGVTPLKARALPPGVHTLVLDKPAYAPVTRPEKITPRGSDRVNATLTKLSDADLVAVDQSILASGAGSDSQHVVVSGPPLTQAQVGQELAFVVDLKPKFAEVPDISFQYEIALITPDGTKETLVEPTTGKIQNGALTRFARSFHFNANPDGSVEAGTWKLEFLIDDQQVVTKQIQLLS